MSDIASAERRRHRKRIKHKRHPSDRESSGLDSPAVLTSRDAVLDGITQRRGISLQPLPQHRPADINVHHAIFSLQILKQQYMRSCYIANMLLAALLIAGPIIATVSLREPGYIALAWVVYFVFVHGLASAFFAIRIVVWAPAEFESSVRTLRNRTFAFTPSELYSLGVYIVGLPNQNTNVRASVHVVHSDDQVETISIWVKIKYVSVSVSGK
jgi:hypothetical protein